MSVEVSPLVGLVCHGTGGADDLGTLKQVTIEDGSGARCVVATFGATLLSMTVPAPAGRRMDDAVETTVVLDKQNLPCQYGTYGGAMCGRVANRVAKGRFVLDGIEHKLACNAGENALHGGPGGFHNVNWSIRAIVREPGEVGVELEYLSKDGEEGYPGDLLVTARYTLALGLDASELRIAYSAELAEGATGATVVNVCNHAYWNLSGEPGSTVADHELELFCPSYLPVDAGSIPLGRLASVAGTPFDFCNTPRRLGDRIPLVAPEAKPHNGVDHCFCRAEPDEGENVLDAVVPLFRRDLGAGIGAVDLRAIARLTDPKSGRVMTVATTQPGVQVYTANWMPEAFRHSAVALETQHFPDAVNQQALNAKFEGTVLRPGERICHVTAHIFSSSKPQE